MHKQTGPFLEWNLALQLLQKALGAKEDRYGESYEVKSVRKRILPSLTPRKDCYKGSKMGGGRGKG